MADNLAVVRQAYESFLEGRLPEMIELLDPAIHWSVPRTVPHGGEFVGLDRVREFFDGVRAAWKPLALDLESVGEVGPDLVAGMATVSGILAGARVSYCAVHVFTVRHGKITRFREYVDLDAPLAG
jgi:ketosteroid isomerase-like protein